MNGEAAATDAGTSTHDASGTDALPAPRSWLSHALRVALTLFAGSVAALAFVILADDYSPTKPIQLIAVPDVEDSKPSPEIEPSFPPAGFVVDGDSGSDKLPNELKCLKDDSRLVLIPGGLFRRGHIEGTETHPEDQDEPVHDVRLPTFYMQETEVTNGQMARYFAEIDPIGHTEEYLEWRKSVSSLLELRIDASEIIRHPATHVSHRLAAKYARWAKGILPTEAHWEYAARSGGQNRTYVWTGTNPPHQSLANIDSLGFHKTPKGKGTLLTLPVKSSETDRTDQGVYDLTGNVREWCRDRWSSYDVGAPPRIPGQIPQYSVRGGAFDTPRSTFRSTTHSGNERGDHTERNLGFRIIVECH